MKFNRNVVRFIITFGVILVGGCLGLPVYDVLDGTNGGINNETLEELKASISNDTPKNLYVVKAVVYEIGILTEVDDDDNSTSVETQERVDLTFFDAHTNESHIDLGNIPLPVQTNIKGQVLTGIAPVNIGAFSSPSELLQTLPLTGTIVNITHSNTAYYQLTRDNSSETINQNPQILRSEDIAQIPQVTKLFPQVIDNPNIIQNSRDKPIKDTNNSI